MKKGIIGKKVGMTQIFDEKGNVIPVTVIEAGPCYVAQKKTVEADGYSALQLAFEDAKEKHCTARRPRSVTQRRPASPPRSTSRSSGSRIAPRIT